MYKYLFGPVPSRRLGKSLGVDLVPSKVCSLDCVYCEVGKTTKLTTERMEYVPYEKVCMELEHFFGGNDDPDYITMSGAGEPTLNSRIGDVILFIKKIRPEIPVAVLTNGTLLHDSDVRQALSQANLVMPSLDAISNKAFQKINRPAPGLNPDIIIDGLAQFREGFTGQIWLEIFLLAGYNIDKKEINGIKQALKRIKPDRVQLNTLDRPGTIPGLKPLLLNELEDIKIQIGFDNIEIIASAVNARQKSSARGETEALIFSTVSRRPCTLEDLQNISGLHVNELNKYLSMMESKGVIAVEKQQRGVFYKLANN